MVNDLVTPEDVTAFAAGITFHGGVTCKPAALTIIDARVDRSFVSLEIAEGKFHQVKKMFLARGKKVIQLKRTAMGSLVLPDDLAVGSYRSLRQEELKGLAAHFR